jgi:hypothetical protein
VLAYDLRLDSNDELLDCYSLLCHDCVLKLRGKVPPLSAGLVSFVHFDQTYHTTPFESKYETNM